MKSRRCEFCGDPINKGDTFCKSCGNSIKRNEIVKDAMIDDPNKKTNIEIDSSKIIAGVITIAIIILVILLCL